MVKQAVSGSMEDINMKTVVMLYVDQYISGSVTDDGYSRNASCELN